VSDEPKTIAYLREMMANYLLDDLYLKDEWDAINARDLLAEIDDLRVRLEAAREAREHVSSQLWDAEQTIAGLRARLAATERVVEAARRWAAAQDDEYEITHALLVALDATPTTTEDTPCL
jgi:hypothetical protein